MYLPCYIPQAYARSVGVTLIACLLALLISAMLSLLAIPSWRHLQANSRATVAINQIMSMLYTARTAAVEQGVTVSICASADGQTCTSDWSSGQLIFVDPNQQGQLTDPNQRLRFFPKLTANAQLTWHGFPQRNVIQFLPTGFPRDQNGTFYYYPANGDSHYARAVILSKTGRVRPALLTATP